MGFVVRGMKNAFRNTIRTLSVTLILALSIGLALIMLLSYQAVQAKITSVKDSIGNTVTVTPAGEQGFQGGGNPLTTTQVTEVSKLSHVTKSVSTVSDRLTPGTDTNLATAIDAGALGARFNQQNQNAGGYGGPMPTPRPGATAAPARTFTVPITVTGTNDPSSLTSNGSSLTSGMLFSGSSSADVAEIGSGLASKNSLKVGSTFTAYGTTITVDGIFEAGSTFADAGMYMPLTTLQNLSSQQGDVTQATLTVDSIDNVSSVVTAVKSALGSAADVTSSQDQATTALAPLQNIKTISLYSLIGALVAGAIITLLTMVMIVRERRREIGVLKAIGSSNIGVVVQFVSEALVLTILGGVVGMILGVLLSNPVLKVLVNNVSTTMTVTTTGTGGGRGFGGGGFGRAAQLGNQAAGTFRTALSTLHASVGLDVILYGVLAALGIAILGSALPAFLIAKVKPAEVMRAE
jgi:putative ABC transport system permease protein